LSAPLADIIALSPDMILLDHGLVGSDPERLLFTLKNNAVTRQISLLILSLHPFITTIAKGFRADAYIEMPFDIYDVASIIHESCLKKLLMVLVIFMTCSTIFKISPIVSNRFSFSAHFPPGK
jgi:response regulator RpfG family c-di-GMP phosphodiesterase